MYVDPPLVQGYTILIRVLGTMHASKEHSWSLSLPAWQEERGWLPPLVAGPGGRFDCVSGNFKSRLCWFEASFERFSFAQGSPSLIDFNHCTVVHTRQRYSCTLLSAVPFFPPQLNGGGRMAGPINTPAVELVSEVARSAILGVTALSPRSG